MCHDQRMLRFTMSSNGTTKKQQRHFGVSKVVTSLGASRSYQSKQNIPFVHLFWCQLTKAM